MRIRPKHSKRGAFLVWALLWIGAWLGAGHAQGSSFQKCRKLVILTKESASHLEVSSLLQRELGARYCSHEVRFNKGASYESVRDQVRSAQPDLMVLMDNEAAEFGIRLNSEPAAPIQGVALMGLNLKSLLKGNRSISGIAYEPPAFSLLTQFRYLVAKPIKRVMVAYRGSVFKEMVDSAIQELSLEGISLEARDAEVNGKAPEQVALALKASLGELTAKKESYDAVWVILDSVLLSPSLLETVWRPAARQSGVPFLTGTEILVSKDIEVATFAVTPNHSDMAAQAAQQIEQILSSKTKPGDIGVENVISVNKVLNLQRAKELKLSIRTDRLGDVRSIE